jgi:hypothetical protein
MIVLLASCYAKINAIKTWFLRPAWGGATIYKSKEATMHLRNANKSLRDTPKKKT